ncbi:MAG: cytidine deaminase [Oscillospiraceae bacterium]|nr:cytidine deaminase [Oscillospiraceae bacterium]
MTNENLLELAQQAREHARAGISGFKVGAALLTSCGKVFTGCNIEDPSGVGVTNLCAERCAVAKALSEGFSDFEKIAVAGGTDTLTACTPCGVCRQYLNSFCPQIKVVCMDNGGSKEYTLSELLPHSFEESFGS